MQNFRPTVLLILLLCAVAQGDSLNQQIRFNSLQQLPGITDNAVYAFEQDREGFLWIGTSKGLYRFDGYETLRFRADRQGRNSLLSDDISDLHVDTAGQLWVGTWTGGLHLYDVASGSFKDVRQSTGQEQPLSGIRSMSDADQSNMWVGTWGQGLHQLNTVNHSLAAVSGHVVPGVDASSLKIAGIVTDSRNRVWMAAWDRGLLLYDPANSSWRQWLAEDNGNTLRHFGRISALFRHGSTIWVGSDTGGIICFDISTLTQSCEIPFAGAYEEQIRSIHLDNSARLWVATLGGGLTRIDMATGKRQKFTHSPANPKSISSNDVSTVFEDRTGNLWLGTLGAGVNFFEIDGQGIAHYSSDPLSPSTLRSKDIRAITEAKDGRIWIGTDGGGLHFFDPMTRTVTPYDIEGDYYDERIWSLAATSKGTLWIGSWGGGVYEYDPASRSVLRRLGQVNGLGDSVVTLLMLDSRQRLWIGTESAGASVLNTETGELKRIVSESTRIAGSISADLATVYEDSTGQIWVGYVSEGLQKFDESNQLDTQNSVITTSTGLNDDDVLAILERSDGKLWLGTKFGLAIFDPTNTTVSRVLKTESTPGTSVVELLTDSAGDLWVASDNGLYRFSHVKSEYERFTRQDGIQSLKFNKGAALLSSDGQLYVGGPNGFNAFDPANITSNAVAPSVVITDIRVSNKPIDLPFDPVTEEQMAVHEIDSLTLQHFQNLLSFRFAALHFVSPQDNQYAYKLEGFDSEWSYTSSSSRIAHYTNLSPGDYELRIRAANSDGLWTSEDRRLAFSILPPWWMTGWAYTGYLLVILLAVFALIQLRTRHLRHFAQQLQVEVQAKTKTVVAQNRTIDAQSADLRKAMAARNDLFARISHEFRTPLTLILGPVRILKNKQASKADLAQLDLVERNTRRVLRLVEQLLGITRSENLPVSSKLVIDVIPVVDSIVASFESSAAELELQISTQLDDHLAINCDPSGFEQVVLNLLSNAMKYTKPGGEISITARQESGNAVIMVSDNGIGISKEDLENIFDPFYRTEEVISTGETGTGLGLTVVKDCVESDHGNIRIESTVGQGTTVILEYPLADPSQISKLDSPEQAIQLEVASLAHAPRSSVQFDQVNAIENAPHIFLVDDNQDMLSHELSILSGRFNCRACSSGTEAVSLIKDLLPDIVISDVNMPGIDGFELTRLVKSDERTCHIPVILLTARADDETRHRGFEEKADIIITKPFDPEELLLRIENLLGLLQVRRQGVVARLFTDSNVDSFAASSDCSPRDSDFLKRLEAYLEASFSDASLANADIAASMAMSERQLQRKLKALLNHSPAELLRFYRLQKARSLLLSGARPSDVALEVGFSSQAHFGACFKARFGTSPGRFAEGER